MIWSCCDVDLQAIMTPLVGDERTTGDQLLPTLQRSRGIKGVELEGPTLASRQRAGGRVGCLGGIRSTM